MDFPGSYASRNCRQLTGVEIAATQDLHMDAVYAVIGGENSHFGLDLDLETCLTYTMISTLYLF